MNLHALLSAILPHLSNALADVPANDKHHAVAALAASALDAVEGHDSAEAVAAKILPHIAQVAALAFPAQAAVIGTVEALLADLLSVLSPKAVAVVDDQGNGQVVPQP